MIETGWVREARGDAGGRWRRALEVLDDYDRGGVLSEQLADDLCSELAGLGPSASGASGWGASGWGASGPIPTGLGPRTRPGRPRRAPRTTGPQPSRPTTTPASTRPRLVLVRPE